MPLWNSGIQFVGIDAQHVHTEMLLNYGMFRRNGGYKCGMQSNLTPGYVKKPERVMDPSLTNIIKGKLELKLISGQNLGHLIDSEVNQHFVYIELEVVDMDPSSRKGIKKSTVVQYNLFHPVWQDQPKFSFDIEYLDCSILFIRVGPK